MNGSSASEPMAAELVIVIDAALRVAPDDPLDRIDALIRAVFRPAVRRPALLGLIREVSRLSWESMSIPQNAIPFTIDGRPYLVMEHVAGSTLRDLLRLNRVIDRTHELATRVAPQEFSW